jgi:O-antigen/teichoic acid export membrane protein
MKDRFLPNLLFLIGINLLIKPIYILGIDTSVQNAVGPNEYGLYLALFNFTFLMQIFSDLGIQNFNSRFIAQDPNKLKSYLPPLLGTKLLLGILFFTLLLLFSWVFGYLKYLSGILGIIALNQFILSFILYLRTNVAAVGKYRLDAVLSSIDKFLLIIICSYLLFFNPPENGFTIRHFVLAQTVSLSICLLICLLVNARIASFLRIKFSLSFSKKIIKQSLPFATIIIMMTAYTRLDAFMLERMLNDNALEAGIYASGFRIYDASNMFGFLFANLLLPMFAAMLGRKEPLLPLVKMSFALILFGAITLVSAIFFLKDDIMLFFYPAYANAYYGKILLILMLSFIPVCGSYIFGTLLTANGSVKRLNFIVGLGVFINIALNLLLIPSYKAMGAAVATLSTQSIVFVLQWLSSRQILQIKLSYKFLLQILLFALITLGVNFLLKLQFSSGWLIIFVLGIIINSLFAFPLKLIRIQDIRQLWLKD